MIRIGTSGYSYEDWVGHFYPEGLAQNEMLPFYAQHLHATEINYTYYRMPNARTLAAMANKVPDDFVFTVKATKEMTHDREGDAAIFTQFNEALQPLIAASKFGCVLAQFPNSFRPDDANREYLQVFRDRMGDIPTVIEFRNAGWITDETMEFLRANNLGYCCVDEPQMKGLIPPIAVATAPIGYVRFHGRNYQKWWHHDEAYERYSYSYTDEELAEWVPKIARLNDETQTTYVFTNNHYQGQSVQTVRQLKALLEGAGEPVK
jgi:uncharacterized protein YecE (DUF72 family)